MRSIQRPALGSCVRGSSAWEWICLGGVLLLGASGIAAGLPGEIEPAVQNLFCQIRHVGNAAGSCGGVNTDDGSDQALLSRPTVEPSLPNSSPDPHRAPKLPSGGKLATLATLPVPELDAAPSLVAQTDLGARVAALNDSSFGDNTFQVAQALPQSSPSPAPEPETRTGGTRTGPQLRVVDPSGTGTTSNSGATGTPPPPEGTNASETTWQKARSVLGWFNRLLIGGFLVSWILPDHAEPDPAKGDITLDDDNRLHVVLLPPAWPRPAEIRLAAVRGGERFEEFVPVAEENGVQIAQRADGTRVASKAEDHPYWSVYVGSLREELERMIRAIEPITAEELEQYGLPTIPATRHIKIGKGIYFFDPQTGELRLVAIETSAPTDPNTAVMSAGDHGSESSPGSTDDGADGTEDGERDQARVPDRIALGETTSAQPRTVTVETAVGPERWRRLKDEVTRVTLPGNDVVYLDRFGGEHDTLKEARAPRATPEWVPTELDPSWAERGPVQQFEMSALLSSSAQVIWIEEALEELTAQGHPNPGRALWERIQSVPGGANDDLLTYDYAGRHPEGRIMPAFPMVRTGSQFDRIASRLPSRDPDSLPVGVDYAGVYGAFWSDRETGAVYFWPSLISVPKNHDLLLHVRALLNEGAQLPVRIEAHSPSLRDPATYLDELAKLEHADALANGVTLRIPYDRLNQTDLFVYGSRSDEPGFAIIDPAPDIDRRVSVRTNSAWLAGERPQLEATEILARIQRRYRKLYGVDLPEGRIELIDLSEHADALPDRLYHWKTPMLFRRFGPPPEEPTGDYVFPHSLPDANYFMARRTTGWDGRPSISLWNDPVTGFGASKNEVYGSGFGLPLLLRVTPRRDLDPAPLMMRVRTFPEDERLGRPLPIGDLYNYVDAVHHVGFHGEAEPFLSEWYFTNPRMIDPDAMSADPSALWSEVSDALDRLVRWHAESPPGTKFPDAQNRDSLWTREGVGEIVIPGVERYLDEAEEFMNGEDRLRRWLR